MVGHIKFPGQRCNALSPCQRKHHIFNLFIGECSCLRVAFAFSCLTDFSLFFRCLRLRRCMQAGVLLPVHHLQVLRAVVRLVSVDMVYYLVFS